MPAVFMVPLVASLGWLWTCVLAVPIWLLWTVCGLGTRFFSFLSVQWQSVSLPNTIALLLLFAIARTALSAIKFDLKA